MRLSGDHSPDDISTIESPTKIYLQETETRKGEKKNKKKKKQGYQNKQIPKTVKKSTQFDANVCC
jgi:hypothetical protein